MTQKPLVTIKQWLLLVYNPVNFLIYFLALPLSYFSNIVGLSGLEPETTGPESVVLPLHHSPILLGVLSGSNRRKQEPQSCA